MFTGVHGRGSDITQHATVPHSQTLLDIKGVSDVKVEKMREAARKIVPSGFTTALSAMSLIANRVRITTGSKALDAVVRADAAVDFRPYCAVTKSRK